MIVNALRARAARGLPSLNGWLSIASPFAAEIVAGRGYDSVTIDLQHGMLDDASALAMLQAIRSSGATPVVRVQWNEPWAVMKALDMGALGVIAPMIAGADDARRFAQALRYPPRGLRSFGPTRAALVHGPDYAAQANDAVLGLVMIETAEAVAELDAILAVPGVDGVYVGPADLTLGLTGGRLPPGQDREEPEMNAAIRDIQRRAKAAGKLAAIHTGGPAYAARAVGWGFDVVTLTNDARLLAAAAGAEVAEARRLLAGRTEP
jgi:4-hydroxy-2-oxoheptanedioate aldolase